MKTKNIIIVLCIALLMVCGLFLMVCRELDCEGDGRCYVDRNNKREKCGDKSCIAYQDVFFTGSENRKNCNCY
jgi:hypothetical protein